MASLNSNVEIKRGHYMLEQPKACQYLLGKNLEDETMVNQQEIFDKGYIAGIIDGEGSIHLSVAHCKSQNGYKPATIYRPRVNVVANTNTEIVQKVVEILQRYKIPFWIKETQKTKANKRFFIVIVEGLKRVPKFIDWFEGIEFAKRRQLEVLREFINLRERINGKENGRNGYPLYTKKEQSLYHKCKDFNQRVPQRLNVTHPKKDEDIVHTDKETVGECATGLVNQSLIGEIL